MRVALIHQLLLRNAGVKRIQLERLHRRLKCHLNLPIVPMLFPENESLRVVTVDVHVPVDSHEPFELEEIQFTNRNVAYFGPGPILKGIVVEEFRAKEQRGNKHPIDLSAAGGISTAS